MNKTLSFVAAVAMVFGATSLKAQTISSLISSVTSSDVVTAVTGGTTLSVSSVTGEWNYLGTAVELSGDDIISSAAGAVLTSQLETKLDASCENVGIKVGAFAFVFNSDLTFTSNVGEKNLGGTYTIDADAGQITLNYGVYNTITIGSLTADVTLAGNSMSLLFAADKLLNIVSAISSYSSNESVQLLATLAEQYNGIKIGAELTTEATTVEETVSSAASTAVSAISKLF
ncbi:MAG: DUF4923 family protein [Rikenellaceae bacterium]